MKVWKVTLVGFIALLIAGSIFTAWQVHSLDIAHSNFENYYAFRGCVKLLERTDTYGTCVTSKGQTIKIVKYNDRWFLDGDLPCKSGFCW